MADGDYVSNRNDVELIYGKANVYRWADSENQKDDPWVEERIDWANMRAQNEFYARLVRGKYDLAKFQRPDATPPDMAILICATRAGLFLYDTREIVSGSGTEDVDEISRQRKDYDAWIRQILAGQLSFIDPTNPTEPLEQQATNAPAVVNDTGTVS